MAAENGGGRFAAALVFDLLHLNAGAGEPVAHGEGQPRGGGGAGEYELAGFLLGGGFKFLEVVPRGVLVHDHGAVGDHDAGDVVEAVEAVVRALGGQRDNDVRPGLREEQRVAVGLGLGREEAAGQPAASGFVHHNHGLPQFLFGEFSPHAGRQVGVAARAVRAHELDGLARIVGSLSRDRQKAAGEQERAHTEKSCAEGLKHKVLPLGWRFAGAPAPYILAPHSRPPFTLGWRSRVASSRFVGLRNAFSRGVHNPSLFSLFALFLLSERTPVAWPPPNFIFSYPSCASWAIFERRRRARAMLKTAATVSRRSTTENGCVRKIMKLPSERVMV